MSARSSWVFVGMGGGGGDEARRIRRSHSRTRTPAGPAKANPPPSPQLQSSTIDQDPKQQQGGRVEKPPNGSETPAPAQADAFMINERAIPVRRLPSPRRPAPQHRVGAGQTVVQHSLPFAITPWSGVASERVGSCSDSSSFSQSLTPRIAASDEGIEREVATMAGPQRGGTSITGHGPSARRPPHHSKIGKRVMQDSGILPP